MRILSLELKNFRCFTTFTTTFNNRVTLVEGLNGSGKSSLVEALHYACYFKSFRTNNWPELIRHTQETAYIKIVFSRDTATEQTDDQYIQIGLMGKKRVVKFNGRLLKSYKELLTEYRVVVVMEDDILMIKGAPEMRRNFIDQAVMLYKTDFAALLRTYRKVLQQRNALLYFVDRWNYDSYCVWTEKLWLLAEQIRQERLAFLKKLEQEANTLLSEFFPELSDIKFEYQRAALEQELLLVNTKAQDPENFNKVWIATYCNKERAMRRTLCGPHLDDIDILFSGKSSRQFASRGQQKLIAVLLKAALIKILNGQTLIILDDFMTDFDDVRMQALLKLFVGYNTHLICTSPSMQSALSSYLQEQSCDMLKL